jgi:fructose-1,6-bisphosphatase/sedoheptulose 1,7-bisphosphatase-like protein
MKNIVIKRKVKIEIEIDEELLEHISAYAEDNDTTVDELVTTSLQEVLDKENRPNIIYLTEQPDFPLHNVEEVDSNRVE